jgi:hypothetical protein
LAGVALAVAGFPASPWTHLAGAGSAVFTWNPRLFHVCIVLTCRICTLIVGQIALFHHSAVVFGPRTRTLAKWR